jgi:hypothetical protein
VKIDLMWLSPARTENASVSMLTPHTTYSNSDH